MNSIDTIAKLTYECIKCIKYTKILTVILKKEKYTNNVKNNIPVALEIQDTHAQSRIQPAT